MASTRYGRIYHSDHHHNNIKFPSPAAREKFAQEFKKYHESHDHDGEVPRFEMIKASDLRSYEWQSHDADEVTIDGYTWYEIKKYHQSEHRGRHTHYHPPTCCVSPIIVLEREFIDSGRLERHELSSIFGDMPDDDFQSLMESVKADGFMDYVIRMHEEKILDGWHRYRAALELNLVRKLRFMSWDADKEGGAVAFVAARNIERRHLSASQRAQIVVSLHERFGWGGDRSKLPNGILKTQKDLAKQANVGERTISRAIAVEKAGKSDEVIAGEKSATQVITEETLKSLWEQVSAEMPDWKKRDKEKCKYESDHIGRASKSMLIQALRFYNDSKADGAATVEELKQMLELMKADALSFILEVRRVLKESPSPVTSKSEKAADREASKLLKQKKKVLKDMWDARVEAAGSYIGDGETDLNKYLSLEELKKWFPRCHEFQAEAFNAGMHRIASAVTFGHFIHRTLESDVSLEDLAKENRAIRTYAFDVLKWEDQEWIQALIQKKKDAESKSTPNPEPEPDDLDTLWEKVTAQMPKWKQKYKESGYKETELVSRASKPMLIQALRLYRESEETDAATIEELKDLLKLLKSQSYPLAYHLRKICGGTTDDQTPAETEETCPETDSEDPEADTSLVDLNLPTLKVFLDTLLKTIGRVEHSITRDNLCVAVYEAFDEYEGISEREQLSILIDCAHTIVSESETNV